MQIELNIVVPSLRSVPISPKKHPKFKNVHDFLNFEFFEFFQIDWVAPNSTVIGDSSVG